MRLGNWDAALPVLIEIKLSDEAAKTGLDPTGREIEDLLARMPSLPNLSVRGLDDGSSVRWESGYGPALFSRVEKATR